jgi:hypothetical protein
MPRAERFRSSSGDELVNVPDETAAGWANDSAVAIALNVARDLLIGAVLVAAVLVAAGIALFGDLGSALGAIGIWGFAMALALGSRPVEAKEPALRIVPPPSPHDQG